jgi:hypothetical protein
MTLERVQHDYSSYEIKLSEQNYTKSNCTTSSCQQLYEITINNTVYNIEVKIKKQTPDELNIKLFPVTVFVNYKTKQQTNKSTAVEGYVLNAD